MVCDALAELVPDTTFDRTIEAARQSLQSVNDYLLHTGTHSTLADRSASTVVALLVRGANLAVLWAGDSRVYRWRPGKLERLTRDHSADESLGLGKQETSNAITRAVGVQPVLVLDLLREKARAGDRFLLCSDGLTRTVPESQIEALMEKAEIGTVVQELISATLAAGAPDNVTVLIAEAFADIV
jgi:serine/threonine protein phosphatase PrpC